MASPFDVHMKMCNTENTHARRGGDTRTGEETHRRGMLVAHGLELGKVNQPISVGIRLRKAGRDQVVDLGRGGRRSMPGHHHRVVCTGGEKIERRSHSPHAQGYQTARPADWP